MSSHIAALSDGLALAQALIRCPSITPRDEGALGVLERALRELGFKCERMTFTGDDAATVDNLYARLGETGPNFCFAGHTDVVPVGDGWTVDPFGAQVIDGYLYGRGAADMKSAIAAFIAAVARLVRSGVKPAGSISVLITGDEEGDAVNGTKKVLERLAARGEKLDVCVVGEPTNSKRLGDMIKIGRRGSLTAKLTVHGSAGHSAYPQLADNPIPRLMALLGAITEKPLDGGSAHFEASTIALTTVDVGNAAPNVIPATARAAFNIRFNDRHTGESLTRWLRRTCDSAIDGGHYELAVRISGEAFITPPGDLSARVVRAVKETLNISPELSTTGGTSDARFIRQVCPVCEFGLVGLTMHRADERCALVDLENLTRVYLNVLETYFADQRPVGP